MQRLDSLTVLGLLIGIIAVVGGFRLEGGETSTLWELTALVIVLGGTVGATMLQTPLQVFRQALKLLKWVIVPPRTEGRNIIANIVRWSHMVRREGLLGLEAFVSREKDPFVQKALQMLVDGHEPNAIRSVMEVDLIAREKSGHEAAGVYEGMGGYSPTIGILGAVLGLIHVMNNLEDPTKLGAGIATAFVATIYGVGFANLMFLPIANKLRTLVTEQIQLKELLLDGIVSIAEGQNPRNIESRLSGYFNTHIK
jgi:chemotaxis protein MotA